MISFIGLNGKEETPKQHWFFVYFLALDPNHRTIDGLINWYQKEKKKDEQRTEKEKVVIYEIPTRKSLYNWYDNFCWDARVKDKIYEESRDILDKATEYNVYMYNQNTKLSMQYVTPHTAIANIYSHYSVLYNQKLIKEGLTNEELIILKLLTNLATKIAAHQETGPQRINVPLKDMQEWNEIKDRLQPHHNPYTSKEEWLQAQFDAIDYYYDSYDNE